MTKDWTADEEREIADQASAIAVNRYWLDASGGEVRIMFMERSSSGKQQYARCAVLMSALDAYSLAEIIMACVKKPAPSPFAVVKRENLQ
jgi:hypothetical protein